MIQARTIDALKGGKYNVIETRRITPRPDAEQSRDRDGTEGGTRKVAPLKRPACRPPGLPQSLILDYALRCGY